MDNLIITFECLLSISHFASESVYDAVGLKCFVENWEKYFARNFEVKFCYV